MIVLAAFLVVAVQLVGVTLIDQALRDIFGQPQQQEDENATC